MAHQQQSNDFHNYNSSGNVDEITHRMDQMNVDTDMNQGQQQQTPCVNIVSFQEAPINCPLESTDGQDCRMSIDDENGGDNQQQQARIPQQQRDNESNILIVTNVDPVVFSDSLVKAKFESLFTVYDERVLFRYLKSFRRVRLDFTTTKAADMARLNRNNYKLGNTAFKCYLAQMIRPNGGARNMTATNSNNNNSLDLDDRHDEYQDDDQNASAMYSSDQQQQNNFYLSIPKLSKQFLISPPVSPPAGWKPHDESSPCIDVQLISAIANMVPGKVHEIHPGNESQPGIFVEVCEESQYESQSGNGRTRIPKTPNPIAAARAAIGQAMRSS